MVSLDEGGRVDVASLDERGGRRGSSGMMAEGSTWLFCMRAEGSMWPVWMRGGRFDMAPLDEVEGWTWLLMNYRSSTVINVHG